MGHALYGFFLANRRRLRGVTDGGLAALPPYDPDVWNLVPRRFRVGNFARNDELRDVTRLFEGSAAVARVQQGPPAAPRVAATAVGSLTWDP